MQHDKDKDGYLTKDEVIQLSESLLVSTTAILPIVVADFCHQFIFRNEPGDAYLASVSKFILNAFDFADAVSPEPEPEKVADLLGAHDDELPATQNRERAASLSGPNNTPYLSERG